MLLGGGGRGFFAVFFVVACLGSFLLLLWRQYFKQRNKSSIIQKMMILSHLGRERESKRGRNWDTTEIIAALFLSRIADKLHNRRWKRQIIDTIFWSFANRIKAWVWVSFALPTWLSDTDHSKSTEPMKFFHNIRDVYGFLNNFHILLRSQVCWEIFCTIFS